MLAVDALFALLGARDEGRAVDPAVLEGDLLEHGHGRVLRALHGADELSGLVEALHGAGVEPRVAPPERHHREQAVVEVHAVEVGDLELAAGRRLHARRALRHVARVEVEAGDRIGALRSLRLLLDGDRPAPLVELHHAEALGVVHVVAEDGGAPLPRVLDGAAQVARKAVAEEDVVAEQALEVRQVRVCRDDEDVANPRHHEDGERVVDHGLVVHGQELLACDRGERVEARARPAREDDAFHERPFL